ncbi:hypothetical protein AB4Z54_13490 [Streptomyces sp. MCAF7]
MDLLGEAVDLLQIVPRGQGLHQIRPLLRGLGGGHQPVELRPVVRAHLVHELGGTLELVGGEDLVEFGGAAGGGGVGENELVGVGEPVGGDLPGPGLGRQLGERLLGSDAGRLGLAGGLAHVRDAVEDGGLGLAQLVGRHDEVAVVQDRPRDFERGEPVVVPRLGLADAHGEGLQHGYGLLELLGHLIGGVRGGVDDLARFRPGGAHPHGGQPVLGDLPQIALGPVHDRGRFSVARRDTVDVVRAAVRGGELPRLGDRAGQVVADLQLIVE